MKTRRQSRDEWNDLRSRLEGAEGAKVRIARGTVAHPRDAGARPTVTWPVGQSADYALEGPPGRAPVVVREHAESFEAFMDGVRLAARSIEAVERNPTASMYVGGALLGGAMGAALSKKREGALVGVGLGLLFAALIDSSTDEDS